MKYKTEGITGYIGVNDVVKSMVLLMNSDHTNERYILVSDTLTFGDFTKLLSNELGVKPPEKTAKRWVLSIAWRLDWLNYKIIGKKRKLTKNMCRTLNTKNYYSSSKFLKQEKGFKFTPISKTISELSQFFLKDVKTF